MRTFRIALLIIVSLIAVATAGCMKTWVADFTKTDTDHWYETDTNPGIFMTSAGDGMLLSDKTVYARYGFTGDKIIYEVHFSLDTNTSIVLEQLLMYLGISSHPSEEGVKCSLVNIGSTNGAFELYDNSSKLDSAINVPGIRNADLNVFRLTIDAGVATFEMNDALMTGEYGGSFNISQFSSDTFVPHILVKQGIPDAGEELCWIKKVVVKYSGRKIGPYIP